MMYKPIFLNQLVYQKEIKNAYIRRNQLRDIIKQLRTTRKWLHRRKDYDVEFQSVLVSKE